MANDNNYETQPLTQMQGTLKIQAKYNVHRDVLTHEIVIKETGYTARDKSIPSLLRSCWLSWSCLTIFTSMFPILDWLPKYSPKRDLMGDVVAGFTVAIMHIPHGMAYGLLAGVSPGTGLYMAVFPAIVYLVLGTSRHISIGTFAVASMMTLKVVQTYSTEEEVNTGLNATQTFNVTSADIAATDIIAPIEVATSLALAVGIIHLVMSFLRLGTLAALLSDPLVNGFTTGAACHVISSQLKDVLGIAVPRYNCAFKIIYTVIDVFKGIPQTNLVAILFCTSVMIFMCICNECLKPCLSKRCRLPFPGELIAVIGGTLISKFLRLHDTYNVSLVGVIPKGLPMPAMPRLDLVPVVAVDAIAIAIVTFSIVMSMGIVFAKKHVYEVRANQELLAMGIGNIVGGCFSCIPMACSLSRSVIQDQTGGVSQLASLVSAGLVVITLLWVGPFFSDLPRCVLAGVIIIALKPMYMQAKELKSFSKQGKLEALTWLVTFLCVVLIDIDIGLLIGVALSLLALYVKGLKPYSAMLGCIKEAQAVYVDINQHKNAVEVPETKIFRYCGSLNFATKQFYRSALFNALFGKNTKTKSADEQLNFTLTEQKAVKKTIDFRVVILDFSMMSHIDVAGCRMLTEITKEMSARFARVLLCCPSDRVYDTLVHSMALGEGPFTIFPTLHDAVEFANEWRAS